MTTVTLVETLYFAYICIMSGYDKKLIEWVQAGLINQSTANSIVEFEQQNKGKSTHFAILIFSVLGAVLTGLGISLMVAENWDAIPVALKTIIAFIPLGAAQIIAGFYFFKFKESQVWKESSGAFLTLSIGATLGIVGQIYQLQPSLSGFLLLWLSCAAPILFVLQSNTSWILFMAGSTWFTVYTGIDHADFSVWHYLWQLGIGVVFLFLFVWKKPTNSAFAIISGWILALSITICLGFLGSKNEEWMLLIYIGLFQCLLLLSLKPIFSEPDKWHIGLGTMGILGISAIAFFQSYKKTLEYFSRELMEGSKNYWNENEFWIFLFICFVYTILLFSYVKAKILLPQIFIFPVFVALILFANQSLQFSQFAINIGILSMGIYYALQGIKQSSLLKLNGGLLAVSALILMRFFDIYISFFARGVAFMAIGLLFFIANRMLVRNEKAQIEK